MTMFVNTWYCVCKYVKLLLKPTAYIDIYKCKLLSYVMWQNHMSKHWYTVMYMYICI